MSLETVQKHAHLLDGSWQSAAEVTKRTCWDLRAHYALIRKTGGTRCAGPGGDIDCDKVVHRQTYDVYDCVIFGGSTDNQAGWLYEGRHPDLAGRLVEPEPYDGSGSPTQPTPPPTPTPTTCRYQATDLGQVLAELAALRSALAEAVDAARRAEAVAKDVGARLDTIRPPAYRGRFLGQTITLTPVGAEMAAVAEPEAMAAEADPERTAAILAIIEAVVRLLLAGRGQQP